MNKKLHSYVTKLERELNEVEDNIDPVSTTITILLFCELRKMDPQNTLDRILTNEELTEDEAFVREVIETGQSQGLQIAIPLIKRSIQIGHTLNKLEF